MSDVERPDAEAQDVVPADGWTTRHPAATYTLARLVLFAVPFALLLLVAEFFTALLVAFLVSAIASIFVLRRQREAMARSVATRAERANQKMAERAAAEDAWDDAQRTETVGDEASGGDR